MTWPGCGSPLGYGGGVSITYVGPLAGSYAYSPGSASHARRTSSSNRTSHCFSFSFGSGMMETATGASDRKGWRGSLGVPERLRRRHPRRTERGPGGREQREPERDRRHGREMHPWDREHSDRGEVGLPHALREDDAEAHADRDPERRDQGDLQEEHVADHPAGEPERTEDPDFLAALDHRADRDHAEPRDPHDQPDREVRLHKEEEEEDAVRRVELGRDLLANVDRDQALWEERRLELGTQCRRVHAGRELEEVRGAREPEVVRFRHGLPVDEDPARELKGLLEDPEITIEAREVLWERPAAQFAIVTVASIVAWTQYPSPAAIPSPGAIRLR